MIKCIINLFYMPITKVIAKKDLLPYFKKGEQSYLFFMRRTHLLEMRYMGYLIIMG